MTSDLRGRRLGVALTGALLCAILLPTAAHAQFGGLIKRAKQKAEEAAADKAGDKAGQKAASADSAAHHAGVPVPDAATAAVPAPRSRGNVLDITPELVDRAIKAADATPDGRNISRDSAQAMVFGQGNQRRWWQMRERVTAFLLIDGDSPTGQCMKGEKIQYLFDDSELAALRARKAELAKRFDTSDDERMTVWGKCASSRGPRKEAKRKTVHG